MKKCEFCPKESEYITLYNYEDNRVYTCPTCNVALMKGTEINQLNDVDNYFHEDFEAEV